ncbi:MULTISPECIES: beta-N-acetylglucosaminidase [Corynebacterium]|uniref:Beta-N-acetylglucosaminidase n=1 Tax=Corynebacterium tuberculostearicum TaxID=38304 RepID=A0AAE4SX51_9CORY|nr:MULTISPECIES: beta-N-acetylglucosaminidase [Corynebacterium]MCT1426896.1 beta-N-acetylglucosaminidase [Corynebacterium sp. p3-SID1241]MDV2419764.1 beta-N-acetylglucosaminidase [Corynebacterium tuberculostearicum]MDV2432667.1 beta-N-acetylglucosaminidase [Corynebacterium tuberculostearicum]MDV2434713.1 beta-N-acetylglucosaminidase [Corynebacterium tuberculostearicum]WKE56377.1 beta-N-acetylglucosaminidase [Corynebacterium tuberculostearicum]
MRRITLTRLTATRATAAALLLGVGVSTAACSSNDAAPADAPVETSPAGAESTAPAADTAEETSTASSSSTVESSAESSAAESSEASEGASASKEPGTEKLEKSVAKAYDIFAPVAPKELFALFDRCDSTGGDDSYNCSGPEVGQFQFFRSHSKAKQTTQVLTELRSSQVIEDDGDRVVGWSTLGTTAVITVVDNKEGMVMQQMISSDQEDPEEKIKELGLAK